MANEKAKTTNNKKTAAYVVKIGSIPTMLGSSSVRLTETELV